MKLVGEGNIITIDKHTSFFITRWHRKSIGVIKTLITLLIILIELPFYLQLLAPQESYTPKYRVTLLYLSFILKYIVNEIVRSGFYLIVKNRFEKSKKKHSKVYTMLHACVDVTPWDIVCE